MQFLRHILKIMRKLLTRFPIASALQRAKTIIHRSHRHKHGDDERCDGLRVAPRRHDVRLAGRLEQRIRVDRHDGGGQQHERGIADVVDDPLLLAWRHHMLGLLRLLGLRVLLGRLGLRLGCVGQC